MTADDLAHSETIPKICMVAPPTGDEHILVRYFTPQTPHNSLAVTGGCCLAVACLMPGTVANGSRAASPAIGPRSVTVVQMRNPAGVLRARIAASMVHRACPSAAPLTNAARRFSCADIFRCTARQRSSRHSVNNGSNDF